MDLRYRTPSPMSASPASRMRPNVQAPRVLPKTRADLLVEFANRALAYASKELIANGDAVPFVIGVTSSGVGPASASSSPGPGRRWSGTGKLPGDVAYLPRQLERFASRPKGFYDASKAEMLQAFEDFSEEQAEAVMVLLGASKVLNDLQVKAPDGAAASPAQITLVANMRMLSTILGDEV